MGSFKILAALISKESHLSLVETCGARYMAFATAVLALSALAAATMATYTATDFLTIERLQSTGALIEGQIVELDIRKRMRKSGHQVWVTYHYQDPKGQTYVANDYRHVASPSAWVKAQRVAVLYDPAEPQTSRLVDGLTGRLNDLKLTLQSCLLAVLFLGAFVLRYLQWRRLGARSLAGAVHGQ